MESVECLELVSLALVFVQRFIVLVLSTAQRKLSPRRLGIFLAGEREIQCSCLHMTNGLLLLGLLELLGLLLVDLQTSIIGVDDSLDQSKLFGCLCLALDKVERKVSNGR